ncbi:MAG: DUF456 domain-containing protein [Prolixibacteraceae bacterium]|jgi:uncharacterized protein YqgC (DUF456 family)|nr:DUF456 domain-containing protein [Prolixibacteraceae bacterium]
MDYFLIGTGILFLILGILGGVLPVIPGPPLSYVALLLLHFTEKHQFSGRFLLIWACLTVAVTVLDYIIPAWGTKRFGGSKRGVWGSLIGLLVGIFFFPPFGIIIGPFIGAIVGEISGGKDNKAALKAGLGSFAGFVAGTLLKLIASGMMAWYFFAEMIKTAG